MTVEQCVVNPSPSCRGPDNNLLEKITEVTGIVDHRLIQKAIADCSDPKGVFQIDDVVNRLLGYDVNPASPSLAVAVTSADKAVTVDLTETPHAASPANKETTIDLTTTGDTDIDRAVAESLRDVPGSGIFGGQVTQEEEQISKVLEQSYMAEDTKLGTKRKHADLWFVDPLNPHERKRIGRWPVGLKNVGNTCWFSAVIQSLFHLPVFRKLVLKFATPANLNTDNCSPHPRNLQFLYELHRLFALMVASKRKYVDPSKSVEILKEAFSCGTNNSFSSSDNQQDVSEFQHKLLDWLEDAFRVINLSSSSLPAGVSGADTTETSSRANNPMVRLFCGQFLSAGINEGTSFEKKELFGQLPLQVDGFKDIHESLEATTAQGEIETLTEGVQSRSCQEQWFVHLPPILTFELSRFQFNKNLARPEKIHNHFDFPVEIFMDRYLESNRAVTRRKREEAKKLRDGLRDLQCRLDRYVHYGSGPKRFPIQDVLQCALEFAEHGPVTNRPTTDLLAADSSTVACENVSFLGSNFTQAPGIMDVDMESPHSLNSVAMDSPLSSPAKVDVPVCATTAEEAEPSPRFITSEELHILQTCLTRWRTEVEQDIKDLQRQISEREEQLQAMYSDPELQKCGYQLHAVLVHEGQAASGHYWAYIYCPMNNEWLKFNDVTVEKASWEDVQKDGVGDYHNTSAYCIMYVNRNHPDFHQVASLCGDDGDQRLDVDADRLLPDLQKYVDEDNERFEAELMAWDCEQRKKTSRGSGCSSADVGAGDASTTVGSPGADVRPRPAGAVSKSVADLHLELFLDETKKLAQSVVECIKENGVDKSVDEGLQQVNTTVETFARQHDNVLLMKSDLRVRDVLAYFIICRADLAVIKLTFLQKLLLGIADDASEGAKLLRAAICEKRKLLDQQTDIKSACQNWHKKYRNFRETVFAFVSGVRAFHNERYMEALPWLNIAHQMNSHLRESEKVSSTLVALDAHVLAYFRRQCLLHVNESAVESFKTEDNIDQLFTELQKVFLPCFYRLVCSTSGKDRDAVDQVRGCWCEVLSIDHPEKKRERLQDFLTTLLDYAPEHVSHMVCIQSQLSELRQYREVGDQLAYNLDSTVEMTVAAGYTEAAVGDD